MYATRESTHAPNKAHDARWTVPALTALVQRLLPGPPNADSSPLLMAKIAIDEAMCALRRARMRSLVRSEWRRISDEVLAAADMFAAEGWVDRPALYHDEPPPVERARFARARSFGLDFDRMSFASGYDPHPREPGRYRWQGYRPNRTAHAWVVRHRGRDRNWIICVPGYSMGTPFVDLAAFDVPWLHRELGLNVLIPVLPLHGPRKIGWASGDGFFSGDCLDTIHAEAQALWDLRRLLAWVRAQGAPAIGMYGLSLGGYTAALLAAFEEDLACVIAGIPPSDLLDLARHHTPQSIQRIAQQHGFDWASADRIFGVISPLVHTPRLPRDRRYLFGGTADRIVPPAQVTKLWRHWEKPETVWYEGSHLSFHWEPALWSWLRAVLQATLCAKPIRLRRAITSQAA